MFENQAWVSVVTRAHSEAYLRGERLRPVALGDRQRNRVPAFADVLRRIRQAFAAARVLVARRGGVRPSATPAG